MRRWRGTIDVPLTDRGREEAEKLGNRLASVGGLWEVYHDGLSRCQDTARALGRLLTLDVCCGPWRMGPTFEGQEITEDSLAASRLYVNHPGWVPPGGESFGAWYLPWMTWLDAVEHQAGIDPVGVVTHNRNIQAVYATSGGVFRPRLYDVPGPDFLSVHYYRGGKLTPWNGYSLDPGIFLIRHGETGWGT